MADGTGLRRGLALLVAGAFFMEILDGTVIAPAAPLIAADLGIRPVDVNIAITGYLVTVAVLGFGALRVLDGSLAVGTLVSFLLYLRRFFDPLQDVAMFYNSYQSATAALEKLSGVLEEQPTVAEPEHPVALPAARGFQKPYRLGRKRLY